MSSTKKRLPLAGALAALATLALAVSCRGFFPPEQLASMTISPATPTVPLGGTAQLSAYGTNTDGTSAGNITGKVTWTSSIGTVSVSSGGLLTGNDLSSSPATITALYQSVTATASATVCVENATVFTVKITPTAVTVGNPASITVTVPVSGSQVDITSGVQWTTNNAGVTITAGDPAVADTGAVTPTPATVTIFGSYSCNGIGSNFNTTLQVN